MKIIGNLQRIRYYGFIPWVVYLGTYARQFRSSHSLLINVETFESFCFALGIEKQDEYLAKDEVKNLLQLYALESLKKDEFNSIKQASPNSNFCLRLAVIFALIRKYHVLSYIETGTQNGISAFNALKAQAYMPKSQTVVNTFDVKSFSKPLEDKGINYLVFPARIRKALKQFSTQSNDQLFRPILFFHDSDHSYENILFELRWALRELRADIIVADDVSGNSAFHDFCKQEGLKYYVIREPQEPVVGVILIKK